MNSIFLTKELGKGIVAIACAFGLFSFAGTALAQDAVTKPDATDSSGDATSRTKASSSPAPGDDISGNEPPNTPAPKSKSGQDSIFTDMDDDETPAKKPAPEPTETVEPPLPSSAESQQAAADVPVPTDPQLKRPYSQWDLSGIESPMFAAEEVNEFSERSILLTGHWSVKPHLTATTIYDGNIFVQSDNTTSDFITRIAPGLSMRFGDTDSQFYITGDYTVGFDWYMQHPSESTVDQQGKVDVQWSLPKTTLGLHLGVLADTGASIDVTNRVRRQLYYAGFTSHYNFGEKTSWDVNADYSRSDYHGLISSGQVEGQAYFNYEYSPKMLVGIGGTVGYVMVSGNNQLFEQGTVRTTYRVSGKLTLIAELGVEVRQFDNGGGDAITPVFSLEAAWILREGTELDLTARRQMYASAIFPDQDYIATSFDVTLRQRCTDRIELLLSGGFVNASYNATASNVSATREDNYFYIRPAIEWRALSWLSIGVFYEYSQDFSSGGGSRSFTRDRGGIQMAILF